MLNKSPNSPEYKEMVYRTSEILEAAVRIVLDLDGQKKLFSGNEEKIFLFYFYEKLSPNHISGNNYQIKDIHKTTFNCMNDIFLDQLEDRATDIQRLHSVIRKLLSPILMVMSLLNLVLYSSIIHVYGHMRRSIYLVHNLSYFSLVNRTEKNQALRKSLYQELIKGGLEDSTAKILSELFPTSHLESYTSLSNHFLAKLRIKSVITTPWGLMEDPLMSALVRNNQSILYYVQHGGGNGIIDIRERVVSQIEEEGCQKMYYWGTGKNNVFPTRYKKNGFKSMKNNCKIILSERKNTDPDSLKFYESIRDSLRKNSNSQIDLILYPNFKEIDSFTLKDHKLGIGYRDNENSGLNIYDSIVHSLIYARILARRPFLIVDDFKVSPINSSAVKFIQLLRESGILISRTDIEEAAFLLLSLDPIEREKRFIKIADSVLKHILDQPKLEDIFYKKVS